MKFQIYPCRAIHIFAVVMYNIVNTTFKLNKVPTCIQFSVFNISTKPAWLYFTYCIQKLCCTYCTLYLQITLCSFIIVQVVSPVFSINQADWWTTAPFIILYYFLVPQGYDVLSGRNCKLHCRVKTMPHSPCSPNSFDSLLCTDNVIIYIMLTKF